MYGIIYKVTNIIDGKLYIGQTTQLITERQRGHYSAKDDSYFHRALTKHGKENFSWVQIDQAHNKAELDLLEQHYIKTLKTRSTQHGYNMTDGGDTSWQLSIASRIKTVSQFDLAGNFIATYESLTQGVVDSGVEIARISYSAHNGHPTGTTRWQFGDSIVYNHKLRARGIQVYQFSGTGKLVASFDNSIDACEQTKIEDSMIRMCCDGDASSAGGYFWSYDADARFVGKTIRKPWDRRPIQQLDNAEVVLAEYKNYSSISKNSTRISHIRKAIENQTVCPMGFKWRRKV